MEYVHGIVVGSVVTFVDRTVCNATSHSNLYNLWL